MDVLNAIADGQRQVFRAVFSWVEGREGDFERAWRRALRRRRESAHLLYDRHEFAQQPQGLLPVAFFGPRPQVRCRVDIREVGLTELRHASCWRAVIQPGVEPPGCEVAARLLFLPARIVPFVLQEAFELAEKLPGPRPQHSRNDDV